MLKSDYDYPEVFFALSVFALSALFLALLTLLFFPSGISSVFLGVFGWIFLIACFLLIILSFFWCYDRINQSIEKEEKRKKIAQILKSLRELSAIVNEELTFPRYKVLNILELTALDLENLKGEMHLMPELKLLNILLKEVEEWKLRLSKLETAELLEVERDDLRHDVEKWDALLQKIMSSA